MSKSDNAKFASLLAANAKNASNSSSSTENNNSAPKATYIPPSKNLSDMPSAEYKNYVLSIADDCIKVVAEITYSGAEHPVDRRIKMMVGLDRNDLKTFFIILNFRGFAVSSYIKKNDNSATKIANVCRSLEVKRTENSRIVGKYSPLAIVTSFPELNIVINRLYMSNQDLKYQFMFNGKNYIPQYLNFAYCFLGGICCMYSQDEEGADRVQAIVRMMKEYDEFQNFYVDSRREAAVAQKRKPVAKSSDEEIKEAKQRTISYYLTSFQTYSLATRKAWYEGEYGFKAEKGPNLKDDVQLVEAIAKNFGMDPENIRNPMPARKRVVKP